MNHNLFLKCIGGILFGIPLIAKLFSKPKPSVPSSKCDVQMGLYREVYPTSRFKHLMNPIEPLWSVGAEVYATIDISHPSAPRNMMETFTVKPNYVRINGTWMQRIEDPMKIAELGEIHERCHAKPSGMRESRCHLS